MKKTATMIICLIILGSCQSPEGKAASDEVKKMEAELQQAKHRTDSVKEIVGIMEELIASGMNAKEAEKKAIEIQIQTSKEMDSLKKSMGM